jgi:hypothetical protein
MTRIVITNDTNWDEFHELIEYEYYVYRIIIYQLRYIEILKINVNQRSWQPSIYYISRKNFARILK